MRMARTTAAGLVLAACAEAAGVPLVHYDRDYERTAAVSDVEQRWLVVDGSLA
jgi:predicted nucleic acid-binding protein